MRAYLQSFNQFPDPDVDGWVVTEADFVAPSEGRKVSLVCVTKDDDPFGDDRISELADAVGVLPHALGGCIGEAVELFVSSHGVVLEIFPADHESGE